MSKLVKDLQLVEAQVETFKGRPVTVWIDERRWVWAPWEGGWMRALVVPRSLEHRITHLTAQYARTMEREWGEPYCLPDEKGMPWYRWHPVAKALLYWRFRVGADAPGGAGNAYRDAKLSDDERFLAGNINKIEKWGTDLQERAMAGALTGGSQNATVLRNVAALGQAIAETAGVVQKHDETLTEHGARIARLEDRRDPEDFLDAETALIQMGRSPNILAPGTAQTEAQWIGSWLSRARRERGPDKGWALPWGQRKTVHTYRRRDIIDAVSAMLEAGEDAKPHRP